MADIAIQKATGDQGYRKIDKLLTLLQHPFDEQPDMSEYASQPPDWAGKIQVSCSS